VEYNGDIYASQILLSAYSVSHDGGKTWKSGFVPPVQGSIAIFGDGALAKDRAGNFCYAGLGLDQNFNFGIIVNKSTDHGDTFAPAQLVALADGGKTWQTSVVAPSTVVDQQHFHPAATLAQNANRIYVGYYVQQADEKLRTELTMLPFARLPNVDRVAFGLSTVLACSANRAG
jgi:hypothetical protein